MVLIEPVSPSLKLSERSDTNKDSYSSPLSSNVGFTISLELTPDDFQTLRNIFQKDFISKYQSEYSYTWRSIADRIQRKSAEAIIEWNKPKRITVCDRKVLVNWVNDQLQTKLLDIYQLSTGVHYCLLLGILSSSAIQKNKINFEKKRDAYIYNFKLLGKAFFKLRIDKRIPERIKDNNLKEILMFTNWFKSFFELNLNDQLRDQFLMKNPIYTSSIISNSYDGEIIHPTVASKSLSESFSTGKKRRLEKYSFEDPRERSFSKFKHQYSRSFDEDYHSMTYSDIPRRNLTDLVKPKRVTGCGRKTLFKWIKKTLGVTVTDFNELANGAVFCLMINYLDSETLPRSKIKFKSDSMSGFMCNYRLLKSAFYDLKIDKEIQVKKIMECNIKEILIFANWLKVFIEANVSRYDMTSSEKF
ncbi:hypothetical protein Ahia01_000129900 [Argonauta hians]